MPRGEQREWPSDEEVAELVTTIGLPKAAKALGVVTATLRSHCLSRDLPTRKGQEVIDPASPISEEETKDARIAELEKALREKRKADVFEQRVIDALELAVSSRKPRYRARQAKSTGASARHEMALLWSDTHYPEIVSPEETNGINSYDPEVMWKRHDVLRDRLASHIEQRSYSVDTLHVWALGDMLSGSIHDELAETNELPLAEATIQFGLDGAEWLESLLDLGFKRIKFAGVVGNHPRFHRKPRAKQSFDNADWMAYHTMRLTLKKNEAIEFDVPKASMWPVTVARRWRALLWHGDGVRSTMPGVPWGGVMRRASALQNEFTAAEKSIDYFCVGHFHQANDVRAGSARIYMNGSVKGVDEYSIKAFGGGTGPEQLLLTFHPQRGCVGTSYLNLDPGPAKATHLKAVA